MPVKKYPYQNLSLKNIKEEQWEDIPWLDGAYQISNFGRIKSLSRWVERSYRGGFWKRERIILCTPRAQVLSQGTRKIYRLSVTICCEGKKYSISIIRIVYFLFVKKFNLDDRSILVTTKDENPFNVYPANLVLTNPSATISRAYRKNHRYRDSFGNSPMPITQYDHDGKRIRSYTSISEASQITGISSSVIWSALAKQDNFAADYLWQYGNKNRKSIHVPVSVRKKLESKKLYNTCITQYDLKGEKINEHQNIKAAARSVNAQPNQIRLVLLGKAYIVKGYYWKLGKGPARSDIRRILEKQQEKRKKSICRSICQYDQNAKPLHTYTSIAEAARKMKVKDMSIICALKSGGRCKGFFWKYVN